MCHIENNYITLRTELTLTLSLSLSLSPPLSLSLSLTHTHTHTVPSAPLNVNVSAVNSTSLRVTWQPPATPKGQPTYIVYYKEPTEGSADYSTLTLPNDENEAIISSLKAYTNYTVMVGANTSCSETLSESLVGRTAEGIPEPPANVIGVALPNAITVKWEPPSEPRGRIRHYNVSQLNVCVCG